MSKAQKAKKVTVTLLIEADIRDQLSGFAKLTRRTISGYTELALLAQFQKDRTAQHRVTGH
jgi:hypothetical protein